MATESSYGSNIQLTEPIRPKKGVTGCLLLSVLGAIPGAILFGYNTGVVNAPEKVIEQFINEVQEERTGREFTQTQVTILWSVVVSIFCIGGMVGGVSAGRLGDRFGRKKAMLLTNVSSLIAVLFLGCSKPARSFEMLIIGRLIIGFSSGVFSGLVPVYLTEVAPVNLRGALGTVNQLGVTCGILVSQIISIQGILGTSSSWPILLSLSVVPVLLQLIILPFCPESPRFLLITRDLEDEATRALVRLRGTSDVQDEIDEMKQEAAIQRTAPSLSMWGLLKSSSLRRPLCISIVMHLSQQLSGINAVLFYSKDIFVSAGLTDQNAQYATMGVGCIMVLMTLISIPLMEIAGRRTLHLAGLGGMFFFSILMTITLTLKDVVHGFHIVSVVVSLLYVVFFAVGPGSIPWIIVSELFPQGPRASAIGFTFMINWLGQFVVGISFKPLKEDVLGDFCFIPFTVLLVLFFVYLYIRLPETKNKTIEEIQTILRSSSSKQRRNPVSYDGDQVSISEPEDQNMST